GRVLEGQQDEVATGSLHVEGAQALVEYDAVVNMHNVIAYLDVAQVGNEAPGSRLRPPPGRAPIEAAEQIAVAEQQQPQFRKGNTFRQIAANDQRGARSRGSGLGARGCGCGTW